MNRQLFSKDILHITNIDEVIDAICEQLREDVNKKFRRYGGVIGISGGIDSSVTLAIAVRAFGADRLLGLMLPETDSSPDSESLARELADKFGVQCIVENISGALDGFGCYVRRDEAVQRVIPEYDPSVDKMKVVIPQEFVNKNLPPVHYVSVTFADGSEKSARLPMKEYLQIVAASNFKQRSRANMLYYHAEALNYAVIGTPNKHEVQQGFFVKYGDGAADVMPIGNLYKTQVYQIAKHLGVPQGIIDRTPTTDTYSAEQTQEEFFYQMPFEIMDLLWYGWENGYSPEEVALVMEMTRVEVANIFKNFARKKKTTEYLRTAPLHHYYI
ncbi:NAD(+) synthase [Saccharicrinis fermentans]|uniref:NH(3)-dependent NAD(+) synthetase n=1 Tax=Saccharicrinis fermentans DSM 9555 = JCM 21142 TaxID=869213 RepID=W7YFR1_9BACT|nr:NAD(+) synthase [Saccharicrinis fermentans]GAF03286.1 NH(3)-dependent NAD(+) synthetase [Saccharicrinis fermentans DSM 9555 = JCM 21142]